MKIGLLGGTFNPVHKGHLLLAEGARRYLKLDQVLWVPARRSPQKGPGPFGVKRCQVKGEPTPEDRAAMVALAIRGRPHCRISRVELERPAPSYTIDTVRQLQARRSFKGAEWYFLVGSDTARRLPGWHRFDRLAELVQFVAVPRPGDRSALLPKGVRGIPVKTLDISSSEIRRRVREGRSIRSLVPEAVRRYIKERDLYLR